MNYSVVTTETLYSRQFAPLVALDPLEAARHLSVIGGWKHSPDVATCAVRRLAVRHSLRILKFRRR